MSAGLPGAVVRSRVAAMPPPAGGDGGGAANGTASAPQDLNPGRTRDLRARNSGLGRFVAASLAQHPARCARATWAPGNVPRPTNHDTTRCLGAPGGKNRRGLSPRHRATATPAGRPRPFPTQRAPRSATRTHTLARAHTHTHENTHTWQREAQRCPATAPGSVFFPRLCRDLEVRKRPGGPTLHRRKQSGRRLGDAAPPRAAIAESRLARPLASGRAAPRCLP